MNAQQLRNSILQEAIHGRLVPQDPADEHASVLLQRIRKEKERLVKEGKLKKKDLESKPIGDDEIPFEIPESWEWVRLENIVSILGDGIHGTPEYSVAGDYYFINGNNLDNGKIVFKENTKKVDYTQFEKYKKDLNETTILVSINGTIGNIAFYNNEKVILGKSACYFNLIFQELKQFIYKLLGTDYFLKYALKKATGSTIKNVSLKAMSSFLIPLPPLPEQQRIVAKIEELLPLVEQYGKAQAELDDLNRTLPDKLKKSVLQEAIQGRLVPQDANDEPASELLKRFVKENKEQKGDGKVKNLKSLQPINENEIPYQIPENWRWVRLGEIFFTTSGGTPLKGHPEYYENGNIPWIKSGDLKEKYLYCAETYITADALKNSSAKYFPINTVAVAMYGATIGKASIFKNELTTNQAVCGIFPNTIVIAEYLYYFILAKTCDYLSIAFGGAQPNISQEKIKKTLFPLPPLSEQRRIVAKIEELFAQIDKLKV